MSNINYVHKKGGDQYCDPPEGYTGTAKFVKINGFRYTTGIGRNPFLILNILRDVNLEKSCILAIMGKPGTGKTYFALRLAKMIDRKFDVKKQVIYDQKQLLNAISEDSDLKRGQVLIMDEAQFSINSRNWSDSLQKDLVENLQAIRFKNIVLIIVILSVDLLDVGIRKHVLNYQIHMDKRGTASVYGSNTHRFTGELYNPYLGKANVLLPDYEQCKLPSCFKCPKSGISKTQWRNRDKWVEQGFVPCNLSRIVYERMKKEYVEFKNKESVERAEIVEKRGKGINRDLLKQTVIDSSELLPLNNRGKLKRSEVKVYLMGKFPDRIISNITVEDVCSMCESDKGWKEKYIKI